MGDIKGNIEEKAKEFFKRNTSFNCGGLYPSNIKDLCEHMPEIDYLFRNRYVSERGETVKTFHYVSTLEGRKWACEEFNKK